MTDHHLIPKAMAEVLLTGLGAAMDYKSVCAADDDRYEQAIEWVKRHTPGVATLTPWPDNPNKWGWTDTTGSFHTCEGQATTRTGVSRYLRHMGWTIDTEMKEKQA